MDLDSPFEKTVLVHAAGGGVEERQATQARLVGDRIELDLAKGGVALFPRNDIAAILPRLPDLNRPYGAKDVDAAIRFLENLPEEFKTRPEASKERLQQWRDLKTPVEAREVGQLREKKQADEEKAKQDQLRVNGWLREVTDFRKARTEAELADLRARGQELLSAQVTPEEKVRDGLAFLNQVVSREQDGPLPDLKKLDLIRPQLVPDDLFSWVVGAILVASFLGIFAGAGMLSSGWTCLREGSFLQGIVWVGLGAGIWFGLVWIWWPSGGETEPERLVVSEEMEPVIQFAKNSVKPAYFVPSMEFRVPARDFARGVLSSVPPVETATGILKAKLKQGDLWVQAGRFLWRQPVTLLGIPLPVRLLGEGKIPEPESWQEIQFEKISLGKFSLPDPLRSILAEAMESMLQAGLNSGGFASLRVAAGDAGALIVTTPKSGNKPKTSPIAAAYRREITAEDLARVFAENGGRFFKGKFVVVEGVVEKVSSGAEFSGVQSAMAGGTLNESKKALKIKDDTFDVFYLRGMDSYGHRKDPLLIKLVVKSPDVFVMDSYGDIYRGPNANIVRDKPFIKKGYRVKFLKEGRVQTDQIVNNEIEVYGVEIGGDEDIQPYDPSLPRPE